MPMTHEVLLGAAQRIKIGRKNKAAGETRAEQEKGQPLSQDGWPSLFSIFQARLPLILQNTAAEPVCSASRS
jgi:hypothetical protein